MKNNYLILVVPVITKPLWAPLIGALTHTTIVFGDAMDFVMLAGAVLVWYGDRTFRAN